MKEWQSMSITFLLGGAVLAGVKYISQNANNPGLAAILGGLPVGLLSVYLLTNTSDSITYSRAYFYNTVILASAIILFYLLLIKTKLNKNVSLTISVVMWAVLVFLRYLIYGKKATTKKV